jgi:hypothetical protein
MTIPQLPPEDDPGTEIPPQDRPPDETPEYPGSQEPEWRAPGTTDQPDSPMRAPSEDPDTDPGL